MKQKLTLCICLICLHYNLKSQGLYFPPLTGNTWDSITPVSLNYCQERIDSLYNYLQAKNTKSFILLKDGKRVLEKYFGTYTRDSVWYWASASKSLASFITGIAQQKGYININNTASQYLGTNWTSESLSKENLITVKDLLKMTSGLDDMPPSPCTNDDTSKACLIYKADAGTRWAYHSGAYKKIQDVVSTAVNQNYNTITNNWLKTKTGMGGLWFQQIYYSKARDMARFSLLTLNKGIWNNDTLLKDTAYYRAMINTSQNLNKSYGYLWWLNGKPTYMMPQTQLLFSGPLIPNAPSDMYCALGKYDQKIYIVPGQNLVVVRQGNAADGVNFALSNFDNTLWDYINKLDCSITSVINLNKNSGLEIYPNPGTSAFNITTTGLTEGETKISITDVMGKEVFNDLLFLKNNTCYINLSLNSGMYYLKLTRENTTITKKIIISR